MFTGLNLFVSFFLYFLVPLVSRILPSDICKIYKSGANIRLDTTLVDFSDMRWERGDISFIFNGDAKPNESLTVLDNILKVYQKVRYEVNNFIYSSSYLNFNVIFLIILFIFSFPFYHCENSRWFIVNWFYSIDQNLQKKN